MHLPIDWYHTKFISNQRSIKTKFWIKEVKDSESFEELFMTANKLMRNNTKNNRKEMTMDIKFQHSIIIDGVIINIWQRIYQLNENKDPQIFNLENP